MGALVVVLGAAVYFFEIRGREAREEAERTANRLLRFETEQVTQLTIETADETIVLVRDEDDWRITEPYDLEADQSSVNGVVNRLQSANHERLVDEEPEDVARFGLDDPEVRATVQLEGGDSQTLEIGAGTAVGFNVYVRRGGENSVFMTGGSLKDAVGKSLFDLRDRTILEFTTADVDRVEIARADVEDTALERQPDPGDGIERWRLTAPIEARADTQTVSSLLRRLGTDRARAFVADSPTEEDLATYGLDEPTTVVTLWTEDDAAYTLQIGGESEDPTGSYARRLGNEAVFVVPTGLVDSFPESVDDLRNRTVVEFARDRVEAIELEGGEGSFRLEKDAIDWRIIQPRALEADASTVSALLSEALALRALEFGSGTPESSAYGFDDPYLSVSFHLEPMPGADATVDEPGAETTGEPTRDEPAAAEEATEGEPGSGEGPETVVIVFGAATEVDDPDAEDAEEGEEPEKIAARYVSVSGDASVFVVDEAELEDLDVGLFRLRSKTLLSFTTTDLTRIEVETGSQQYVAEKSDDTWSSTDGTDVDTDVDDMLWNFNYLRMEGVVAEEAAEADLAAFGLDEPELRVIAYVGGETIGDVTIGDPVPESELEDRPQFAPAAQVYATVGGHSGVFRINAKLKDSLQQLVDVLQ